MSEDHKLWRNSIIATSAILLLLNLYSYFYLGFFDIYAFNRSLANAAIILIGLSFSFSGLAYFFRLSEIIFNHRKYLGLMGFWVGLLHGLFSAYSYLDMNAPKPEFDLFYVYHISGVEVSNLFAFIAAVTGLIIFIFMAIITNNFAIRLLGKHWRPALRIGYIAYVLVIIHFTIKRLSLWIEWLSAPDFFPDTTLMVAIFAWSVIFLRVALFISERRTKNE